MGGGAHDEESTETSSSSSSNEEGGIHHRGHKVDRVRAKKVARKKVRLKPEAKKKSLIGGGAAVNQNHVVTQLQAKQGDGMSLGVGYVMKIKEASNVEEKVEFNRLA